MLDDHVAHGPGETALALVDGDDRAVLGVHGLDLEPGVGTLALRVGGGGVLNHRALETLRDEAAEGIVRGQVEERGDERDGVGQDHAGHEATTLGVGADIVGQVEQPEAGGVVAVLGADGAHAVEEVGAGHGLAVEGEHAVQGGQSGEHALEVLDGGKRVAVAGLEHHGQRLAADLDDHADAVNLRLAGEGLGEDALVGLGQHGLRQGGLAGAVRAHLEAGLGFDHLENLGVEVRQGVIHGCAG